MYLLLLKSTVCVLSFIQWLISWIKTRALSLFGKKWVLYFTEIELLKDLNICSYNTQAMLFKLDFIRSLCVVCVLCSFLIFFDQVHLLQLEIYWCSPFFPLVAWKSGLCVGIQLIQNLLWSFFLEKSSLVGMTSCWAYLGTIFLKFGFIYMTCLKTAYIPTASLFFLKPTAFSFWTDKQHIPVALPLCPFSYFHQSSQGKEGVPSCDTALKISVHSLNWSTGGLLGRLLLIATTPMVADWFAPSIFIVMYIHVVKLMIPKWKRGNVVITVTWYWGLRR